MIVIDCAVWSRQCGWWSRPATTFAECCVQRDSSSYGHDVFKLATCANTIVSLRHTQKNIVILQVSWIAVVSKELSNWRRMNSSLNSSISAISITCITDRSLNWFRSIDYYSMMIAWKLANRLDGTLRHAIQMGLAYMTVGQRIAV